MTMDVEEFRTALREQPENGYAAPDLDRIVARGRRIRRRRHALHAMAVVVAVAVIALGVGLAQQFRTGAPPVADGGPTLSQATRTTPVREGQAIGEVVPTGLFDGVGEIVIYASPVDIPSLPNVHFGLMGGHRTASGQLVPELMSNVTSGSDRAPGFRLLDGGREEVSPRLPVFGYYVGPAAKITSTVNGRTVQAAQVTWSEDPNVVIFWFSLDEVPSSTRLTPPRAYSATGALLP